MAKKVKAMTRTEKLIKLKDDFGGACSMCGESRYQCLEFHHTNPREVSGRPSWRVVRDWKYEDIMTEYKAETVLLCRNCHGDVHFQMNQRVKYHDD